MNGRAERDSRVSPLAHFLDVSRRLFTPWVWVALASEVVLAILDASLPREAILTSIYLVPVLALALVETGSRTALVAVVATALAVASGAWHHYLLTGDHLYRLFVVVGGGVLGTLGAVFRTRALLAYDRMETLARIGEIADGTGELAVALERVADALVPGVADLCEVTTFGDDGGQRVVSRINGGLEARLSWRPPRTSAHARVVMQSGHGVLVRLPRGSSSLAEDASEEEVLAAAGLRFVIYAPVRVADESLALLAMAVGSGRRYGRDDVRFARTVGSRAALAIQNSRLVGELHDARMRMEAIVGSLADAVTIREPSGRLVYANDAALQSMGLSSVDELREQEPEALFNEFLVSDERGSPLRMHDLPSVKLLAGEFPEPLLLRFVHREKGAERWSLLKTTPLYDARGRVEAAVTVIEDVTASKRAALRSEFLARASEILAASLDYEETLGNVAWLAVPEVADWCAVDLVDERGRRQQVVAAHRDPEKLELAERIRKYEPDELDPEQGLGAVLRTGKPELYRDIPQGALEAAAVDSEHLELLRALRIRSVLIVPMRSANRIIGAMSLVNAESGRSFSDDDLDFALEMAARAAVAVENARLYSERSHIATTLQHSLLPDVLPKIEGWELASLYRPASPDGIVEVGGDFYDAFPVPGGWLMLIGDVTGKGVEAATMTSLVRHGARFVSDYVIGPADILARLDRALREQPTLSLCTALCLRIASDRVTIASAGHPLPLLVSDDGVRAVGRTGPVLGAFADGEWPTEELALNPGDVLLLYTDGVTDTVGNGERFGEQRLCAAMGDCGPLAPPELLGCLDTALSRFQVGVQADDTAALALRLTGEPQAAGVAGGEQRAGA